MLKRIEAILNEKVRPELAFHSGDVEVLDFDGGVLPVSYTHLTLPTKA